jgi:hypothetical protein
MKKYTLLFTVLLSGCASNYHPPKIIDTNKPYVGVHYDSDSWCPISEKTPRINPYTYNPACLDKDGLLVKIEKNEKSSDALDKKIGTQKESQQGCESYYSIAMGLAKANSTSIDSEFIKNYKLNEKDNAKYMAEIKERILNRDALVEAILAVSQDAVSIHKADIEATQSDANLFLELVQSGAGAAAAVASSGAANALGAVVTGSKGAEKAFLEKVYKSQIAGNINNLITQEREKKLIEIRNSLANKDIYEYSADRGIADAIDFHEAGSFYKGLELVSVEIAKTVNDNKNFTDDARGKLNLSEEMKTEKLDCHMKDPLSLSKCVIAKDRDLSDATAKLYKANDELSKATTDKEKADKEVSKAKSEKEKADLQAEKAKNTGFGL